jgi:hypothetical protein
VKRATAGILATIVLGGCIAQPTPSTVAPSNPSATLSALAATLPPLPSASTPTPSPTPTDSPSPSQSEIAVSGVVTFPTAPPATANWPTCTTFQLAMSGVELGAGLGNVAALFRLRNASADGCVLEGYPGIQLISRTGVELPTTVRDAVTGAYMFPAVRPQRVALGPGDSASFELGYGDNPFVAGENLPLDMACPPTRWVRIFLPGTDQFGTAEVAIAPCEGLVIPSPIYPGVDRLEFP